LYYSNLLSQVFLSSAFGVLYNRLMVKTKKAYFEPVEARVDFTKLEEKILDEWYKRGIVKKYLDKNKSSKKHFSFQDGPITANNPMGVHHGWGRTYKDLWQRYKNMLGYKQRFQNGFDCQGLWVEVEVEKELGLKSKKDIENLVPGDKKASIAKFVELCKARVEKYAKVQTEQSKRLGYFMDWENSYFTMSEDNNYMIWHFLKRCHEQGLIYKGTDSVAWCPRCGTAISQHEMLTEDYKEITHKAIYVGYPIVGREDEYLMVWTTTPWTLPANVAVAVDSELTYVLAKERGGRRKFWMLPQKAKELGLRAVKKAKGKALLALNYISAFDGLPAVMQGMAGRQHLVVAGDERILPISEEEGTGMVHVAPGAGAEDFALGKKEGLPVINVINEEAKYLDNLGEFSGKSAKDEPEIILDYIRRHDGGKYFFKVEKYKHRYPACWRCKTELVWRVVDEWYISMDKPLINSKHEARNPKSLRESMVAVAKTINWIPGFGLQRELDWLENMHDWLISKKRYWGLALPIWECEQCSGFEVIGSKQELEERQAGGWSGFEGKSPHRPWVDEVRLKCDKCGGEMKRVEDVGNPWLDAGIVPYSTISKDNKGKPLYWEDKKEWEKWFPVDFITESFPGQFKNWFYSMIAMSTVLEDSRPFDTVLGFATLLAEDGRAMHKSWGNAIEFNEGAAKIGVDVMRWMYVRQNPSENLLFGYKVGDEVRRKFHIKIWNIYNFFVTYANLDNWRPSQKSKVKSQKLEHVLDRWIVSRFGQTVEIVEGSLEKYDAYHAAMAIEEFVDDMSNWYIRRSRERTGDDFYETCYFVLVELMLILAPFTPFITEVIYRNLTGKESVHLASWPKTNIKVDAIVVARMASLRDVVERVHSARKEKGIAVRQPLGKVIVTSEDARLPREYLEIGQEELNIKKIEWRRGKKLLVKLDTKITPELEQEAKARELVRKIQVERRESGVKLNDSVVVTSPWIPSGKLKEWVMAKTLAKSLEQGSFKVKKC